MPSKWFKFKVTHHFIIIWLSLSALLHNILMNGANNVVISSLQKEFYLSSRETGVYVSVYDIGSLASAAVIPFVSARGSKPRWISFGMVMLFIGCFVNVLPHFLRNDSFNFNNDNSIELCNYSFVNDPSLSSLSKESKLFTLANLTTSTTPATFDNLVDKSSNRLSDTTKKATNSSFFQLKYLLYVANGINGLSSASMTSLAFSYIEDIAPSALSSIYESIYFALGAFGVGIGFIITSKCLNFHTDFNRENNDLPEWLVPSHPNWIGAWWLPFSIFGIVGLFLGVGIFLFPKRLDNQDSSSTINETELNSDDSKTNNNELVKLNNNSNYSNGIIGGAAADIEKNHQNGIIKKNGHVPTRDYDDQDEASYSLDGGVESNDEEDHVHKSARGEKLKADNRFLTALDQTGSMISINQIGFYASQANIDKIANNNNSNNKIIAEKKLDATKVTKENSLNILVKKTLFLFKNPIYIFVIITATIEGLLQNSFLAFASLFLEYQYRLASGTASFILGLLSIPPLIIGGLIGGLIVKKLKNNTISCFKFLCVLLFINIIAYAGFLVYCKEPIMISNKMNYNFNIQSKDNQNSNQNCYTTAENCNCDLKIFKPVCLSESKDIFFQSACLAGCRNFISNNNNNKSTSQYVGDDLTLANRDYYSQCLKSECDEYFDESYLNLNSSKNRYFIDGLCPTSSSCNYKIVISYACIFMLMLLNALTFLPFLKVTIGCIDKKEMNTIVLGIKQFFMNAFGTIPGPILFGSVIDSTCSYWHTDLKDQRVCKIYNNQNFSFGFGMLGVGFKSICFILISFSLVLSIKARNKSRNSNT